MLVTFVFLLTLLADPVGADRNRKHLRAAIVRRNLCNALVCQKCLRIADFRTLRNGRQIISPERVKCLRILFLPRCCSRQLSSYQLKSQPFN